MSRKRIVLCLSQSTGSDSVAKFVTRYFNNDHRLIPVYLPTEKLVAEELLEIGGVQANQFVNSNGKSLNGSAESYSTTSEAIYDKIYREARFSDLLVVNEDDYHRFFHERNDQAELGLSVSSIPCPKLIIPPQEESIEQIILIDDGKPATHAQIKYLCCLFAELCLTIPTVLLITQGKNNYLSSQEQRLWIDYLKVHFAHLAVHRFEEQMVDTLMFAFDTSRNAHSVPKPTCLRGKRAIHLSLNHDNSKPSTLPASLTRYHVFVEGRSACSQRGFEGMRYRHGAASAPPWASD